MNPSLYLSSQRPAPPLPKTVKIGNTLVGDGQPCFFVAEIGINHNGNPRITEFLIDAAAQARCNAVKFQKRTPDLCVPESQKSKLKETEWGEMTYIEYRRKIELTKLDYQRIDAQCAARGIMWFASCWDIPSVEFISQFDVPCFKVASATLTDDDSLRAVRGAGKPILLSTGMSTLEQIDHAIEVLGDHDLILLHSVSSYPAYYNELNLRVMQTLRDRYSLPVGYSGHETGIASSTAAAALGAAVIERHITKDRSLWGSDQAASLEPSGLRLLMRDIRLVEQSMGTAEKRVLARELPMIEKLRMKK